MTSSMLRRQLKNLVQNYSEAEVKVREATSNDPWGPSSSQMADISDLTYNVVACNEIMTMLWKRLKDDKNWRHIHKSLTLLEYLLKTGDDRVLLKMKDNIYIVKALTEYRFVEKDGKDQGSNVRDKAKVVLVLMEDDDKLKEEREFAVKTREKTSKGSAASSADTYKDPNYKPCYVPGAMGLPSLDNIPSVADLTASFTARKEERLKQEAEKKDAERRAKMSEDELKWEDAGKVNESKAEAWGGAGAEEKVETDAWGGSKEPKEAADPWGTPSGPATSDTAASSDPWGASTKTEGDSFEIAKAEEDPFAAPKEKPDPFTASTDGEDPFGVNNDSDPFSASKEDPVKTRKDSSDAFNASKDEEDPFAAPNDKPDPFSSSNIDPFATPKDDPFSTAKEDPFISPKDDPFNARKDDPFSAPKDDPFNTPKDDAFSAPKDDPFNTPKDDAFSAPKDDPFNTPKDDPFNAPKDDPFNAPKDDAFSAPKDDPFNTPKDDPFSAPKDDPFNTPKDDPFNTPKDDPFSAAASSASPKEDPFAPTVPPQDDPFAAPTTPPKEDPQPTPTALSKDDPFGAPTTPPREDPFSALSEPTTDDLLAAAPSPPKEDPFAVPSNPPNDDTSDPFSAPPLSSPQGSTDAWGAPASSPPAAGSDAWGAPSTVQLETKGGDPWGDGPSASSLVDNSDPFGDASKPDDDPWGAPASAPASTDDAWGSPAPPTDSCPSSDPFGDGASKTSDPWGAPSNTASNGTGKRTAKEEEVHRKTALFLGSAGASLVDFDDLFSPKQRPLINTLATQTQAIGSLKVRVMATGHVVMPGDVAGVPPPAASARPGGPFGSITAPPYGATLPTVGAAHPSSETSLFRPPSLPMRGPHSGLNMNRAAQMAPPHAGTGTERGNTRMGLAMNPTRGLPGFGNPSAGTQANPLLPGTGMVRSGFLGVEFGAGWAQSRGSTPQAGDGVSLQPQLNSGRRLGETLTKNNNPFLL